MNAITNAMRILFAVISKFPIVKNCLHFEVQCTRCFKKNYTKETTISFFCGELVGCRTSAFTLTFFQKIHRKYNLATMKVGGSFPY